MVFANANGVIFTTTTNVRDAPIILSLIANTEPVNANLISTGTVKTLSASQRKSRRNQPLSSITLKLNPKALRFLSLNTVSTIQKSSLKAPRFQPSRRLPSITTPKSTFLRSLLRPLFRNLFLMEKKQFLISTRPCMLIHLPPLKKPSTPISPPLSMSTILKSHLHQPNTTTTLMLLQDVDKMKSSFWEDVDALMDS